MEVIGILKIPVLDIGNSSGSWPFPEAFMALPVHLATKRSMPVHWVTKRAGTSFLLLLWVPFEKDLPVHLGNEKSHARTSSDEKTRYLLFLLSIRFQVSRYVLSFLFLDLFLGERASPFFSFYWFVSKWTGTLFTICQEDGKKEEWWVWRCCEERVRRTWKRTIKRFVII